MVDELLLRTMLQKKKRKKKKFEKTIYKQARVYCYQPKKVKKEKKGKGSKKKPRVGKKTKLINFKQE